MAVRGAISVGGGGSSFATIAGLPADNAALSAELDSIDATLANTPSIDSVDAIREQLQGQIDNKYGTGDLASQAQAEAGTDNASLMTPLRTAQAIAALGTGEGGGGTPAPDTSASREITAAGPMLATDVNVMCSVNTASSIAMTVPIDSTLDVSPGKGTLMLFIDGPAIPTFSPESGVVIRGSVPPGLGQGGVLAISKTFRLNEWVYA